MLRPNPARSVALAERNVRREMWSCCSGMRIRLPGQRCHQLTSVSLPLVITAVNPQSRAFSNGNGGACVEVARNLPGIVAVRDSQGHCQRSVAAILAPWYRVRCPDGEGKAS